MDVSEIDFVEIKENRHDGGLPIRYLWRLIFVIGLFSY